MEAFGNNKPDILAILLMELHLDNSQLISIVLLKNHNTKELQISVGNITYNTLKSVELYLDNELESRVDIIEKYRSGILTVKNLENIEEIKIKITNYNGQTTEAIITGQPLQSVKDKIK